MVEAIAESLAAKIKRANQEQTASIAVMKFAIIIVLNFTIPVVTSLAFGAFTGKWFETITATGFFVLLRMVSGGYHLETPIPCMLLTFAVMAVPPHLTFPEPWTLILTAVAFVLVTLLAPANMKGYNTIPERYYPLLKFASMLVVSSNFLFHSQTAAIVLAIQGMTLLFHNKEVNQS
ncbi:accessory gene regulator ArgB-like protein [Cohnella laeviribosi]|uniref:accessory gene regulator ArgB-like protein n=1 Tax=Cohnella laeviribosi TaxID=380174 RepID=UPI000369A98E|nr:accessory gene regulator B family protein [Cohnella laeviribosi]